MASRIIVLGSSFAGVTAALELRQRLPEAEVVVLSASGQFTYTPSLIWVPFGLRRPRRISFPIRPLLEHRGVAFRRAPAQRLDLRNRRVVTTQGVELYDYLVIATGPKLDFQAVPGLGPQGGHTQSIFSPRDARRAHVAFQALIEHPGPVVIGAAEGATLLPPTYEFLFNMAYQLRQRGLRAQAPLVLLTPEPHLAHFGFGGVGSARSLTEAFCRDLHIEPVTSARIRAVTAEAVHLADGRAFPFVYAMIAPPSIGVEAIRACREIVDDDGFVLVQDSYRTAAFPEVFAAGAAVSILPPQPTPVRCRPHGNIHLSEEMGRVVAYNIAAEVRGEPLMHFSPAEIDLTHILDAGNTGMKLRADHYAAPSERVRLDVGPGVHFAKLAMERSRLSAWGARELRVNRRRSLGGRKGEVRP